MKIDSINYATIQAINSLWIANKLISDIPHGVKGQLKRKKLVGNIEDMIKDLRKNIIIEYSDNDYD
jgi:hypothetical protein